MILSPRKTPKPPNLGSIPIEWAEKGVRKEDHVLPWLNRMARRDAYGVYFIFKSMEQGPTYRIRIAVNHRWTLRGFAVALWRHAVTSSPQIGGWTARQIHHALRTTFDLSEKTYGLDQLRYDLRKLKGHGLIERDGSRYAYRLTQKGVQVALLFLFFHKRLCGPLANSRFHHRPAPQHRPNSRLEVAYHRKKASRWRCFSCSSTSAPMPQSNGSSIFSRPLESAPASAPLSDSSTRLINHRSGKNLKAEAEPTDPAWDLRERMACRRFTSLQNGFSKRAGYHLAAVGLFVAHFNFSAARTNRSDGAADHVWTMGQGGKQ